MYAIRSYYEEHIRSEILFLDEPTLGLDVTMQRRIRTFLADYNLV